jgi:hypothetical protein
VGWLVAVGVLGLVTPVARADVFAAVEVHPPGSRQDFDIELVHAATGVHVPLPSGVNTTADELHPSISEDGTRLVFERRDSATGTLRIIAVDLKTGQSSDLFTGFETAQSPPTAPVITPDGQTVLTGGPFQPEGDGAFVAQLTQTSLNTFPSGPYVHQTFPVDFGLPSNGQVADVAAGSTGRDGSYVAEATTGSIGELVAFLPVPGGAAAVNTPRLDDPGSFEDPAMAASNPQFVLFVRDLNSGSAQGDIEFVPPTEAGFQGSPTPLPAVVNTALDESQPAVSADGRYIAFVRHGADGDDRLLLWDSQTQLLLNSKGVDLGPIDSHEVGSVSLYTTPALLTGQVSVGHISNVALANVENRLGSGLGILVQRIVGHHRVLGRREYKLRLVGRVPLGFFKKGHHHLRWNLRVNGRRLQRGRYLVTLRAVTRDAVVRDLAKPHVIRIR